MRLPGVAVAVDVDNLLISTARAGHGWRGFSLKAGFENMFAWINTFGSIFCVYLYQPLSQCVPNDKVFHELWEKYKNEFVFEVIYCPKKISPETGKLIDNVDEHLIFHTERMVDSWGPKVQYFCLASGDRGYSPFLWNTIKRKHHLEIAFVVGSKSSFSKVYQQVSPTALHPQTGKELIHYFLPKEK